ncbi:MAG: M56 family metallopeptidase, partial [Lachnospiraceae bacterium]
MAGFINILLSLSISGAFLTLILILLKPLYKKRASQKWQYYIWLVVIIRLLFPFTINFNITVNTKQAEDYFPETLLIENTKGTEQLKNIQEINTSSGKENTAGN